MRPPVHCLHARPMQLEGQLNAPPWSSLPTCGIRTEVGRPSLHCSIAAREPLFEGRLPMAPLGPKSGCGLPPAPGELWLAPYRVPPPGRPFDHLGQAETGPAPAGPTEVFPNSDAGVLHPRA